MNYPPAKDGWVSAPTNSPLKAGLISGQAANPLVPRVIIYIVYTNEIFQEKI